MKTAVLVILLALMIISVTSRPQHPLEGKLSLFDAMVEHSRDIFQ